MSVWSIAKIAATRIPWGRLMENLPVVVDMANRAKGRFMGPGSPSGMEARLHQLEEENRKLEKALLETSGHLQLTIKTLKVVLAREKLLMAVAGISLLVSIAALIVALS
ncbi:hypothetical protein KP004_17900 [Geomonas oryzisoli]|uniref:DUF1640 domain-containing protein n=1 Tax=Geomonas oryzisoli TaxID=2847992 RepID=A0ABX8J3M9_9BACT|nr:hypothetical protein [Geomonas oryzisoli]QWV93019.1 hypothetical protein KP004_17900 [Geomonas oryzisoli]